ncbi:efflux RND transporter periplasmic adaptor subunit [Clostridium sp. 'White wine YQ']|uniref:efflux RND transporter periplasmic adaptor subunit n=1 Tax=Clostridium sp. 'White wine YQ' TaxID=3027474 RepID=UPI0023667D83|nr:efflux RND transporter periplasmic adaptor subunit [Clostridium sp. 'White wine YQ']MDD7796173.1 efflux RND transporter periplasmic adaptor subunit [Clostridium sp. 'White wine YQ']
MKRKLVKYIVAAVVVIAVATGGYVGYNKFFASKATATSAQYMTVSATKTNIAVNVQGTGAAFAGTTKDISANNNGTLTGLNVKVGDTVKAGDTLFVSDSQDVKQNLDKAKSNLDKANSQSSASNTNSQVADAQAAVNQAQSELTQATNRLNSMTSTSPVSGNVTAVNDSNGDYVGAGKPILTITDSNGKVVQVTANNSGTIEGLSVTVGSAVSAGQKLFTTDNQDLKNAVSSAQDDLNKAKSALSSAQRQSSSSSDTSGVSDAQSQYNSASEQVSKMTVTSPIDGVVTQENNANGDDVQSGKSVLTVVDPSSIKVKVAIDEMDINKVKVGQKAQIKFDAISDKTFDGSVESIALTGASNNNVTTYDVVVSVANPTDIKIGMNANVNISVENKDDVLAVPTEALVDRNGTKYVMVESASGAANSSNNSSNNSANSNQKGSYSGGGNSGRAGGRMGGTYSGAGRLVEVKTGIQNENYVEILDGLTEGEKVLIALPKTTTTSTTGNRSGFGGMGGLGGSMGGGASRQSGGGNSGNGSNGNSSNAKSSNGTSKGN